jgi:hypothetical protein
VRLRPLSEAECYARCYGARSDDLVTFARGRPPLEPEPPPRSELREFLAEWLDRKDASSPREAT